MDVKKPILQFAAVAFIIIGILFGMSIMVFIFGNMGSTTSASMDKITTTVINRSGAWINATPYRISEVLSINYSGNLRILNVGNNSLTVEPENYTYNQAGYITNTSAVAYNIVNITFAYDHKSTNELTMENINNASLTSIKSYSQGATTQMNVLSISMVLVLLLGVFGLFWYFFMGAKGKGKTAGGNFS